MSSSSPSSSSATGPSRVAKTNEDDTKRQKSNRKRPASGTALDASQETAKQQRLRKQPPENPAEPALVQTLRRLDPILCFLTRATGHVSVSLPTLQRTIPPGLFSFEGNGESSPADTCLLTSIEQLLDIGILCDHSKRNVRPLSWKDNACRIGFPPPTAQLLFLQNTKMKSAGHATETVQETEQLSLHGSTKMAAKRRLSALKQYLKLQATGEESESIPFNACQQNHSAAASSATKAWDDDVSSFQQDQGALDNPVLLQEERDARDCLAHLLGFQNTSKQIAKDMRGTRISLPIGFLPRQVSYAGSSMAQESVHVDLQPEILAKIPLTLLEVFGLHSTGSIKPKRRLFRHQSLGITSAMRREHCIVCTGTGSGKSLSFLLPVLAAAYNNDETSLIIFPTKALAQDQLAKLNAMLCHNTTLSERIRPAALDGDCPHSRRTLIAEAANVILTNPDTLHAAILPSWRTIYSGILSRLAYVVIDEAHMYEGVFGAHVAMILSRLVRVTCAARQTAGQDISVESRITFLSASATLPWPEKHFRLLCPVSSDELVTVLGNDMDGSPRSAKHFFVWNPPILNPDGTSTGKVFCARRHLVHEERSYENTAERELAYGESPPGTTSGSFTDGTSLEDNSPKSVVPGMPAILHRRHAADETALLFACAVANNIRCIVFCKTRNLVEWVFERAINALKRSPKTSNLISRIESYRGGYSTIERRKIEGRLFRNDLLGVVGTNALELGIDIGGIDLTLHCGYPSSYASLLQQAGRAGRGYSTGGSSSCAVVVCFNSPTEQHLWRNPKALLGKGVVAPPSLPINGGLLQGHLVCASSEFPLGGDLPVTSTLQSHESGFVLNDHALFGGQEAYEDAIEELKSSGSVVREIVATGISYVPVFRAHASMQKPWARLSIRSIEPIQYSIVNITHPKQDGRMDGIYDEQAVIDTLPYSRVFFHAHPGAIITHRGARLKVVAMTSPPEFKPSNFGYMRNLNLAAFAKPTTSKYITRPLSNHHITVIKQLDRVELEPEQANANPELVIDVDEGSTGFAGCGVVNVKRTVHGYKKLSLVTRDELSRTELSLPPMEFDTFGLWMDTGADQLLPVLGERYGAGVHALSHALLAVAPTFAPGIVRSDLECDHSHHEPRRLMLFDERAGGSGVCSRLWRLFFEPASLLEAAIELLDDCPSCSGDERFDSGCPSCILSSECLDFNTHLSKSAGVVIGKLLLQRIKLSDLYATIVAGPDNEDETRNKSALTPRRRAREKALKKAKEMTTDHERQFVVNRAAWPLDAS